MAFLQPRNVYKAADPEDVESVDASSPFAAAIWKGASIDSFDRDWAERLQATNRAGVLVARHELRPNDGPDGTLLVWEATTSALFTTTSVKVPTYSRSALLSLFPALFDLTLANIADKESTGLQSTWLQVCGAYETHGPTKRLSTKIY